MLIHVSLVLVCLLLLLSVFQIIVVTVPVDTISMIKKSLIHAVRYKLSSSSFTSLALACNNGLVPVSCVSSCLPTCQIPDPVCSPSSSCIPGCGCPDGTVYDQIKQTCINPLSCGKAKFYFSFIIIS